MFKPLAVSQMIAMAATLLVAVAFTPVLGYLFLKVERKDHENPVMRTVKRVYLPVLDLAVRRRKTTVAIAALLLLIPVLFLGRIGTEFLPYLDEGAIALNVVKYPTVSLENQSVSETSLRKCCLNFPRCLLWSPRPAGRTSPKTHGPEQNDLFIILKPKKFWKAAPRWN